MTTEEMYEKFGIKKDVIDFGKTVLGEIEDRFAKIDEVAEINQLKVILPVRQLPPKSLDEDERQVGIPVPLSVLSYIQINPCSSSKRLHNDIAIPKPFLP